MNENAIKELVLEVTKRPRPLLLAFDIDGTLAPYHIDPQSARVPEQSLKALQALCDVEGVTVALITGRAFPSMNGVISLSSAWRSAEHGAVILQPGADYSPAQTSEEELARLKAFDAFVKRELMPLGADYEEKPRARAVHTRAISQSSPERDEQILNLARDKAVSLGLFTRDGHHIVEAELDRASKGEALRSIDQQIGAATVYFAGDDLTDLPAIAYAKERSDLGVFVLSEKRPEPPPEASHALPSIEAHLALIDALAAAMHG